MAEVEVAFVKIQPRKGGSFMVTIPSEAVKELGIKDRERVKVLIDKEQKRVIYQLYVIQSPSSLEDRFLK